MRTAFDLAAGERWLITEAGLAQILAVAQREGLDLEAAQRLAADRQGEIDAVAMRGGERLAGATRTMVRDGVAILPVTGPMFRYANLLTALSGATSTQVLASDFQLALDSRDVRAIVLSFDSPGGQPTGIAELAGAIRAGRAVKPIAAYVGDLAASAAYWLASAAGEIVLSDTGMVGSIGAVMTVRDTRERDARDGVRSFEIVSSQSPRKRLDPATREGEDAIRAMVDALAAEFVAGVAVNRGVSQEHVLQQFGGGGMVPRTADAIAARMADRTGTLEGLIRDLAAAGSPRKPLSGAAAPNSENAMDKTVATMSVAEITAANPQAVEAIRAAALAGLTAAQVPAAIADGFRAEGREAAVAGERQRIAQITRRTLPGHAALRDQAITNGTAYADFLDAQTAAEQEKGGRKLDQLRSDERETPKAPTAPVAGGGPAAAAPEDETLPIEDQAKAAWDKSADLRAEFGGTFADYLAFRKADARGQVRILGPR